MAHSTTRPIIRRNVLLLAAAVLYALAIGLGYRPWRALVSLEAAIGTLLIIAGSLFAAMGIRELAGLLLGIENKPWYAQPNAMLFLLAMLAAINVLWQLALHAAPQTEGLALEGTLPAALATQLAWVVILDWTRLPYRHQAVQETCSPASIEKPRRRMRVPSQSSTPLNNAAHRARRRPSARSQPSKKRKTCRQSRVNRRSTRLTHEPPTQGATS